jgi:hypothetical protein
MNCPHRFVRWTLPTRDLHIKVRRSKHMVPVPIEGPARTFFPPIARSWLQEWLECSEAAVASRQAAVQESYEKARFNNLQNLRKKQKEADGILDIRTIQAALGKCQPRQRMWGVSGNVVLGVCIELQADQHLAVLELLRTLPTTDEVVYLSGSDNWLSLWFSGPRQAGDFISLSD